MLKNLRNVCLLSMLLFNCQLGAEEKNSATCYAQQKVKQDLAELYKKLKSAHYNLFVNTTPEQYQVGYQQTEAAIRGCMKITEITLLFQKFVSLGKVAHARIELPTHLYAKHQADGGKLFPLYIKSDGQKIWVTGNYSQRKEIQVGDQIKSINGIATQQLLTQLRPYLSADTDRMYGGFLEFYLGLLLWFEYGELDEFNLVLQQGKSVVDTQVKTITVEQRTERAKSLPKTLQLDWERVAHMLDNQVAYLRPGPFFNTESQAEDLWDNAQFKAFIDQSFKTFKQEKATALLIDLRDNPGGDNSFSDLMVRWIADKPFKFADKFEIKISDEFKASNEKRLKTSKAHQNNQDSTSAKFKKAYQNQAPGTMFEYQLPLNQPHPHPLNVPVFMLINRHSYSNAVTVAAMAKDYGFAAILGEETSDLATTYGAMEHFQLSHTEIKVGFPKAFIVRPSGDETIRGVVPDHSIRTPMQESEDDQVLQEALGLVKKKLAHKVKD